MSNEEAVQVHWQREEWIKRLDAQRQKVVWRMRNVINKEKIKKAIKTANNIVLLRIILIAVLLIVQMLVIFAALNGLNERFVYFYFASSVFGLLLSLVIVNNRSNPGYKMAWIILVLFLPIFGTAIYLILGSGIKTRKVRKALAVADQRIRSMLNTTSPAIERLMQEDRGSASQMHYLQDRAGCPAYEGTYAEFLSPGEVKFERMKAELQKAERFIFLEYFIIENGRMWQEILDILIDRVEHGVEVRVMYDDFGSLLTLPYQYGRYLRRKGIKTCVFGKLVPVWSVLINHRDHRKILVIDGKVGFTGGINIADEYINEYEKHGHWKDASVVLTGEAVWSLTVFFLSSWGYVTGEIEDFKRYRVHFPKSSDPGQGIIQPYLDSPMDYEPVGETVYLNMISRAERYIYFESPYLVIDNEMMTAFCNAAKQGVDVRIVTPHIGDHWYVHALTRSNYQQLVEGGVKIYEYTPGFIHSKVCICDDKLAVVGTVNLDYRSLYLHFENAALFYRSPLIASVKKDFFEIIEVSEEITLEKCKAVHPLVRLGRGLLKVFAPLI